MHQLVVRDSIASVYLDGRRILSEHLPENTDPWLVLSQAKETSGSFRNLHLSGSPTVPENLNLSAAPGLHGWLNHYYEGDEQAWQKRGAVIYGQSSPDALGAKRESLLQYHRPMLEDGTISYEFYYIPGSCLVHPALDRLALMLEPEGVRIHWLTDSPYDLGRGNPGNIASEPSNRRGPTQLPLRPHAWNSVHVSVAGNQVRLTLNDVEIYERTLEPTNQRIFGFFHYTDESEARIRNVNYRGNWPRQLPPADKLLR